MTSGGGAAHRGSGRRVTGRVEPEWSSVVGAVDTARVLMALHADAGYPGGAPLRDGDPGAGGPEAGGAGCPAGRGRAGRGLPFGFGVRGVGGACQRG